MIVSIVTCRLSQAWTLAQAAVDKVANVIES